jgi:ankyrin repeat protein
MAAATDVNEFMSTGYTPLIDAILNERIRVDERCDPDEFEYNNNNIKENRTKEFKEKDDVTRLIAAGADVNKLDRRGDFSPLAMAIKMGAEGGPYKCVILDLFKAGATFDKTAERELVKAKKAGENDLYMYVMYLTAGRMQYNIKKAKHNLKKFHFKGPMSENVSKYFGGRRRKTLRNKRSKSSKSKKRAITRRLR